MGVAKQPGGVWPGGKASLGNLVGVARAPVGLQNVDDSDVQEQPLPAPIHCWDPTHPAQRDSDQLDTGGLGSQLWGPPCWEQTGPEAALGPSLSNHSRAPCRHTLPGHGCLKHPKVLMKQACPMRPSPVSDLPRRLSGPEPPAPSRAPRRSYKAETVRRQCTRPLLTPVAPRRAVASVLRLIPRPVTKSSPSHLEGRAPSLSGHGVQ